MFEYLTITAVQILSGIFSREDETRDYFKNALKWFLVCLLIIIAFTLPIVWQSRYAEAILIVVIYIIFAPRIIAAAHFVPKANYLDVIPWSIFSLYCALEYTTGFGLFVAGLGAFTTIIFAIFTESKSVAARYVMYILYALQLFFLIGLFSGESEILLVIGVTIVLFLCSLVLGIRRGNGVRSVSARERRANLMKIFSFYTSKPRGRKYTYFQIAITAITILFFVLNYYIFKIDDYVIFVALFCWASTVSSLVGKFVETKTTRTSE